MTEQQKRLLAKIQKNATELKFMSALWRFHGYGNAIMDINCILDAVDALEAVGKCKAVIVGEVSCMGAKDAERDEYKEYACLGCIREFVINADFHLCYCPSCGRELEVTP
jgi:DNA-directed RNA polymerase subunit RPC12/RpoP